MLYTPQKNKFSLVELPSFDPLCNNKVEAGEKYAAAVMEHSRELGARLFEANPALLSEQVAVIGIPRGGVPTAVALHDVFNGAASSGTSELVNSDIKTTPDQLYRPGLFNKISSLLIVDGVIGTGSTICKHMEQIPTDWKGNVTVFANAASELGIKNILDCANEKIAQPVTGLTGRIFKDDECQWMSFGEKKVYFIGYNKERGIDYKLPDFGDYVSFVPS